MKKLTLLVLFALIGAWSTFAQIPIGIQEGTTNMIPIRSCYGYSYTQQLVYQDEVNAGGDITSLSFYYDSGATDNSDEWTVYLGHTTKTQFSTASDWVPISDLTQVFSGTVSFPAAGNQMLITFDTPFVYDNIDNLVVAVDENQEEYNCSIFLRTQWFWVAFNKAVLPLLI